MTPANFRHIGGVVVADHGGVSLAAARALVLFYDLEARHETSEVSDECRRRAHTLEGAVIAASAWRRAAGWDDPDLADCPRPFDW